MTKRGGVLQRVDGERDAVGHSPCVGRHPECSQSVMTERESEALRGTLHANRSTLVGTNETSILETNSDSRAGDVRFQSIPTPTPTGGGYVGGMVAQGV